MSYYTGNIEWTENLVKTMLQLLRQSVNQRPSFYRPRVKRSQHFQRILNNMLPMCPQLTVWDIKMKYNNLSQELDDLNLKLKALHMIDLKKQLPYWYDDMSYLQRYFSDTKMESEEDDQQPGGSAKRFKPGTSDFNENNPNSDDDEDVTLVSEHVPLVPKEERSNRGNYSPGVNALGELVKEEMESISDPHHRKMFRNEIMQTIINNSRNRYS